MNVGKIKSAPRETVIGMKYKAEFFFLIFPNLLKKCLGVYFTQWVAGIEARLGPPHIHIPTAEHSSLLMWTN